MEISAYFKSIVDQDICAVVICDTQHRIIYMNPSAVKPVSYTHLDVYKRQVILNPPLLHLF